MLDRFYTHFPEFLPKILSILVKYVKIVNNCTVDFLRDKSFVDYFDLNFWLNIPKFSIFQQKLTELRYFSPL